MDKLWDALRVKNLKLKCFDIYESRIKDIV